jgi:hypothetical protein
MRRNILLIDALIAVVLAILVIVISPGVAVAGLLAILVVLVCGVSLALDRRRTRRREDPMRELRRSSAQAARERRARRPAPTRDGSRRR